jgi:hypothetical protein
MGRNASTAVRLEQAGPAGTDQNPDRPLGCMMPSAWVSRCGDSQLSGRAAIGLRHIGLLKPIWWRSLDYER